MASVHDLCATSPPPTHILVRGFEGRGWLEAPTPYVHWCMPTGALYVMHLGQHAEPLEFLVYKHQKREWSHLGSPLGHWQTSQAGWLVTSQQICFLSSEGEQCMPGAGWGETLVRWKTRWGQFSKPSSWCPPRLASKCSCPWGQPFSWAIG